MNDEEQELKQALIREVILKQQWYEHYMNEKKYSEKLLEEINKLRIENIELLEKIKRLEG